MNEGAIPMMRGSGGAMSANSSVATGAGGASVATANPLECADLFDFGFHGEISGADAPYMRQIVLSISQKDRTGTVMSCHVMSCHVISCHIIPYHVMSCRVD